ncbi:MULTISPECIES: efflux RND transporter periplasmic adaptor subunit [unclassified Oceanispirochaeta]|uniref:efflux RND transporter periplasmic adaptor subunit n=1 Tax=unclassified Oceanispirochaeta TaxID=2635722 RepID=UPI000E0911D4|nr:MULTISPECIES: efflux RND transporter periplasmic adaptor subunit [unclassified Oceanispirochaeta]MBF9018586.1 efflux RND transporter periplasmic adaptor subunit [Oceanispirochaeta sp. M2]NPD75007.1 HlyD family efflux transporter periplasmic adaptor subunit [Oceanispirochaeta sp. M1]RDG29128.1 HlyD family efflux transporter periplasmic adaptor subunit [Oceanispirochaeta sp. M1]
MTVKKMVYIGFLLLLPLILLLNSGFLYVEGALHDNSIISESASIEESSIQENLLEEEVSALTVEVRTEYLLLSGEVRPMDEVDIFPETQGKVREMRIEAGDSVITDQILAMIDPSRPGMNYTLSPVKSSIRGTVTAVYADPGAFITAGQPLCRIGTLSQLEVEVYVPEGSIDDVYKGMTALVSSPVLPGLNESLVLNQISPVVDPLSRCMKVVFVPEKKSSRLKSGMFVDLTIPLE